jgi:hypothetical protein
MKKKIYILVYISLLLFTSACRKAAKDVNDYLPKIKLASATVQDDGSVVLSATIESKGYGNVEEQGFCMSTNPIPKLLDRQVFLNGVSTDFSAVYENLSVDSVYYFRAFATNKYGYAYSNIISLSGITPVVISPPCSLNLNSVNLGTGSSGTISSVSQPVYSLGVYSFSANASNATIQFEFGSTLNNAIYTTTTNTTPVGRQVRVTFTNFNQYLLNDGSSVYVKRISPGIFEITICDAPYNFSGSSTASFKTRFNVTV